MKLRLIMACACPYWVPQGSQVYLRETALAMAAAGHETSLVVYGYGRPGGDGVPVRRGRAIPWAPPLLRSGPNWWKPAHDLLLATELRRAARDTAADLVCAHNAEALAVSLAAAGRPVLYFAHNAMAEELPCYFTGKPALQHMARRAGRFFDTTFPRRAAGVVAPHRRLAGYLALCGCDPAKILVVPPPLDAAFFNGPAPEPQPQPAVLYTGNQDAYQNLGLLEAAMARVRKSRPGARLVVQSADAPAFPGAEHGPGADAASLREALAGDVIVAVPRTAWSGYPVKLLNAMAAGRPVVACAGAAWPLEDGVNGLVVPDHDADAFAAAIVRLMDDWKLRHELGRAARETVLRHHSPAAFAETVAAFAESLLSPK